MSVSAVVMTFVLLGLFALWVRFAWYVSYSSHGGSIGMVPVLGHAIGAPTLLIIWLSGMGALAMRHEVPGWWFLPWWADLLVYVGAVVAVGWLIVLAGKRGERDHRDDRPPPPPYR